MISMRPLHGVMCKNWLVLVLVLLSGIVSANSGKVVYCRVETNNERRFNQNNTLLAAMPGPAPRRGKILAARRYKTGDAPEACIPAIVSDTNDQEVNATEFQSLLSAQLWNRPKYDLTMSALPALKLLSDRGRIEARKKGGRKGDKHHWDNLYYHVMYHSLLHYGPLTASAHRTRRPEKHGEWHSNLRGTSSAAGADSIAASLGNQKLAWLDFGVFQGWSVNTTSLILQDKPQVEIHGFDTWQGLPENWSGHMVVGDFSTQGVIPPVREGVTLHKGFFNETLPLWLEAHPDMPIYGISVDCDLYNGSMDVLTRLGRRLQVGSIVHFHELRHKLEDGQVMDEARALYDWLKTMPSSFRMRLIPMQDSTVREPAAFIVTHL